MEISKNASFLTLSEIVVELFDNKRLADIAFACGNKKINAHSFILMSRSIVYEMEFRANQGVQKLIPIQKYNYEHFYEFVRFIYKDMCTVNMENATALLELSVKYKIPKLENMVVAHIMKSPLTIMEILQIFEFCETENYQLLRDWISKFIAPILANIINSDEFLMIQPKSLKSILKWDFIGTPANPIKEVDLFNALIKWMNNYCAKNGIPLTQRRIKFDALIRSIRFPSMVFAELTDCIQKSENLFTDADYVTFFKPESGEMWNAKPRGVCQTKQGQINVGVGKYSYQYMDNAVIDDYYTKAVHQFESSGKIIITGVRLRFSSQNIRTIKLEKNDNTLLLLNLKVTPDSSFNAILSFGESVVLEAGCQYRLVIDQNANQNYGYGNNQPQPKRTSDIVHKDFASYYRELASDSRLVYIFLKTP